MAGQILLPLLHSKFMIDKKIEDDLKVHGVVPD